MSLDDGPAALAGCIALILVYVIGFGLFWLVTR